MNVMINAVRKAARSVQRDFGELLNLQVAVKAPGDYVTAADKRCERVLRTELEKARPEYGFLGEEEGATRGSDPEHRWLVDPIDGTTNFMHAVPFFATSLALERNGEIIAGVVYNPITDEMFTAQRGGGAYLNNRRLRVAQRTDIHDTLVCTGIPHRGRVDHALSRAEIAAIQAKAVGIRRMGCASLELAYVAAGRFDAFWERRLSPWDIGAGVILVREAGGFVSDIDGDGDVLKTGNILATNVDLLPAFKKELAAAKRAASTETETITR
jgi:myo-inositol-1(or 4)-monophosphatase